MNVTYNQNYMFPAVFAGPVHTGYHRQPMNVYGLPGLYGATFLNMSDPGYVVIPDQFQTIHPKNAHNSISSEFHDDCAVNQERQSTESFQIDLKQCGGSPQTEQGGCNISQDSPIDCSSSPNQQRDNYYKNNASKSRQTSQQQLSPVSQLRLPSITVTPNMAANVMSEECDLGYCSFTDLPLLPDIPDGDDSAPLSELLDAQSVFADIIDDVLDSMNSSDLDSTISDEETKHVAAKQTYEIPPISNTVQTNTVPVKVEQHNEISLNQHTYPQFIWTKSENGSFTNIFQKENTTHKDEFGCDICGKLFQSRASQKAHMRAHRGERPHQCNYCEKSFTQKSTLRTHIRTHTGEKPYVCQFCSRAFSDYSTFRKHVRIHTGEKPYSCDVCGRSFTQSGNMIRHREMHTRTGK